MHSVHTWMNTIMLQALLGKQRKSIMPASHPKKETYIKAFLHVVMDDKGARWGSATHWPMLTIVFLVRRGNQILGLCYSSNTGRKTTVLHPSAENLMTQTPFLQRLETAQLLSPSFCQTKLPQASLGYSRLSAPAFFSHTTHASSLAKTSCNITFQEYFSISVL